MRRRRKRLSLNPKPILGILFLGNLVLGIYFSRLTSIGKVQVEGALPSDSKRVEAILQRIHDRPALLVNSNQVESWLNDKSEVLTSSIDRNIFGRATVHLVYRSPVARVSGRPGLAVDRNGTLFQTQESLEGLAELSLPEDAGLPGLALASSWRCADAARLASALKFLSRTNELRILASGEGRLCLNIGSKFAVDLGDSSRLDDKVDFLLGELNAKPDLLSSGKTLVLVSVDNPVYRLGISKGRL